MKYILAHDLGTSGNKATLFSEEGTLLGSAVFSYPTDYFRETWVEQDPQDWWRAVCETSQSLIQSTGVDKRDIAVVSFSGQMMGCLCVDKAGHPLRKSIIWADQRAQAQQSALTSKISPWDYYRITGHRNSASYGIQKLMWVRDNEPDIYRRTYKTLNAKDYIILKLTGKFLTEPTDATGNACLDINTLTWSQQVLQDAGIEIDKMPEIVPSVHVAGGVTRAAAQACGLLEGTMVVMGGGDGICANVGAGSVRPGQTFSYVGSSAWIASTSTKPLFDEQMRTVTWAHIVPGMYAPNGTMQSAGGSVTWVKNQICLSETTEAREKKANVYELIDSQIKQSPVGANGILFLPYLLGERAPRWNPDARGAFLGLKMENKRSDILRAVLEGVTLNLGIILDTLRQNINTSEILVIGGGAKSPVWRQIMADVYNADIKVPVLLEEATSMGAAVTGGVGVGLFSSFDIIDRFMEVKSIHKPDPLSVKAYHAVKDIFELSYHALLPVYQKMAGK